MGGNGKPQGDDSKANGGTSAQKPNAGKGGRIRNAGKARQAGKKPAKGKAKRPRNGNQGNGNSPVYFQTVDEIAEHFKISKFAFCRRRGRPGYPAKTSKGYPLEAVAEFVRTSGLVKEPHGLDKDQELAKAARMRWQQAEFDLAVKQGKMISREDHGQEMRELAQIFLRALLDVLGKLKTVVKDPRILDKCEAIIRTARMKIAERVANLGG